MQYQRSDREYVQVIKPSHWKKHRKLILFFLFLLLSLRVTVFMNINGSTGSPISQSLLVTDSKVFFCATVSITKFILCAVINVRSHWITQRCGPVLAHAIWLWRRACRPAQWHREAPVEFNNASLFLFCAARARTNSRFSVRPPPAPSCPGSAFKSQARRETKARAISAINCR